MSETGKKRDYRLVLLDGVASAGELQRDYDFVLQRSEYGAAPTTVEALMLSLRSRGAAALAERDTKRRLADLSVVQVRQLIDRLIKLQPRYPRIGDELISTLREQIK